MAAGHCERADIVRAEAADDLACARLDPLDRRSTDDCRPERALPEGDRQWARGERRHRLEPVARRVNSGEAPSTCEDVTPSPRTDREDLSPCHEWSIDGKATGPRPDPNSGRNPIRPRVYAVDAQEALCDPHGIRTDGDLPGCLAGKPHHCEDPIHAQIDAGKRAPRGRDPQGVPAHSEIEREERIVAGHHLEGQSEPQARGRPERLRVEPVHGVAPEVQCVDAARADRDRVRAAERDRREHTSVPRIDADDSARAPASFTRAAPGARENPERIGRADELERLSSETDRELLGCRRPCGCRCQHHERRQHQTQSPRPHLISVTHQSDGRVRGDPTPAAARATSEPNLGVHWLAWSRDEHGINPCDETSRIASRPALVRRKDETGMAATCGQECLSQRTKVAHVLCEDGATLGSRVVEHLLVGRARPGRLVNRDDVVPASS